jgi:hypothetical protein
MVMALDKTPSIRIMWLTTGAVIRSRLAGGRGSCCWICRHIRPISAKAEKPNPLTLRWTAGTGNGADALAFEHRSFTAEEGR